MSTRSGFRRLRFIHLFNGLATTNAPPVVLVGPVAGVVLVDLASADPLLISWQAHWPGGQSARVSKLDPGDCDMLRATEASLNRLWANGDAF